MGDVAPPSAEDSGRPRTAAALDTRAYDLSALAPSSDGATKADRDWRFELVPYLWLAGLDGSVGGAKVFSVDETFDSLSEFLDGAFMGAMRVQYRNFALLADGNYMSLGSSGTLRGPLAADLDVDLTIAFGTAALAYELKPEPGLAVDPYLGARWWSLDTTSSLQGGGILGGVQKDSSTAWADPVVGVYVRNDINDRWFVEFAGDVGGGVSKITWQVYGAVGYAISDWFGLSAGYRFLGVDYDRDDVVFDVVTQGLLLGARFDF